jgi:hypothetical protein
MLGTSLRRRLLTDHLLKVSAGQKNSFDVFFDIAEHKTLRLISELIFLVSSKDMSLFHTKPCNKFILKK